MAAELPYLPSYKNVGLLFEKIATAKIPENFTNNYLYDTIGIKSSGDRPLISLLKALGFLDNAGKPTENYAALKNDKIAGTEIAKGMKKAYQPLFDANEKANELETNELKGLVAQVAGTDSGTTSKIVGTFKALLSKAVFNSEPDKPEVKGKEKPKTVEQESDGKGIQFQNMRPDFHYNLQVHLPSNGSEETYMNIFNAIRKVFK